MYRLITYKASMDYERQKQNNYNYNFLRSTQDKKM